MRGPEALRCARVVRSGASQTSRNLPSCAAVARLPTALLRTTFDAARARLQGLLSRGFVRSVAVLAGGTAFAQALGMIVLPVLTRLYTPADFSVLGVYASILNVVAGIACLRYETGIPLPERDDDAARLLVVSVVSSAVFSVLLTVLVVVLGRQITALTRQPALGPYLYLVPLGTWTTGLYTAVQFWAVRKKQFARIARTRVFQSVGGSAVQVGLGCAKVAPLGLLLGTVFNGGAGIVGLAREAWRDNRSVVARTRPRDIWATMREYVRFPKYAVLDTLANNGGTQIPLVFIAAVAVGPEAGYLTLATRVMAAPMALIGGAVAQVYLARAPEELRSQSLAPFTAKILEGLFRTGLGPLLYAGIVAAPVFALLFGPRWRPAGELVAWMTPWFALQFLSSPVSMVMHVVHRERALLAVTLTQIPLRFGGIALAYRFAVTRVSDFYALAGGLFYLICFVVFYRAAGVGFTAVLTAFRRALAPIVGWVGFGLVTRITLHAYGR